MTNVASTGRRRRQSILFTLLAVASFGVAGCQRSTPVTGEKPGNSGQTAPDVDAVIGRRWNALFSDPASVRKAANDFGYRVGPYAPAGSGDGGFKMVGVDQVLPDASLSTHVSTGFSASGHEPARLDRIEFRFDVVRPDGKPGTKKERNALQIPRRAVQGFLARFEVGPSDPIKRGLQDFNSATETTSVAQIIVTARNVGAGHSHLVVSITPK